MKIRRRKNSAFFSFHFVSFSQLLLSLVGSRDIGGTGTVPTVIQLASYNTIVKKKKSFPYPYVTNSLLTGSEDAYPAQLCHAPK